MTDARRACAVFALAMATPVAALAQQTAAAGKTVYDKWCAGCHGDTGAGDGAGAQMMLPHPRDFTKGVYKIRTTASGEIPTDDDLRLIVEAGMPGTAMPEWKTRLSDTEIRAVVAYIKSFSPYFASGKAKAISVGSAPSGDGVEEGRAAFKKLECFKCHGQDGRGDGTSAPTLKTDDGHAIRAADLTESWKFRGGRTVEQIYTRLRTGLDGTPMPSFTDAVENKLITDEQLWRVAQYVRSLSPAEDPQVKEVMRAARVTQLPAAPQDGGWDQAQRYWVPLVGQVIVKPRAFAPSIDGVWVQALHDGQTLALRLTWDDPSRSPDAGWQEWLGRVSTSMSTVDGAMPTAQGPDRLVVQFPPRIDDDVERPYFLGGNTRKPVHVWRWSSTDSFTVGSTKGLGAFTAIAGQPQVRHAANFANGQWQLMLTRALTPVDTMHAPRFLPGQAIPVAFYAADGSNGEDEVRGAVSTWYALYLDTPTPPRVFVAPVVTMVLAAGLGILLVTRARREDVDPNLSPPEASS